MTRAVRGAGLVLLLLPALAACKEDLRQQRRLDTYGAASIWHDGTEAQPIPPGTVARDDLAFDAAVAKPPEVTPALLERGRDRYNIYCQPCHGPSGNGDGIIVQRGFPPPPSFHQPRLRAAPAEHFMGVITGGFGVMYSYAARVAPPDRWAIIAYIRALQLAHGTTVAQAPEISETLR